MRCIEQDSKVQEESVWYRNGIAFETIRIPGVEDEYPRGVWSTEIESLNAFVYVFSTHTGYVVHVGSNVDNLGGAGRRIVNRLPGTCLDMEQRENSVFDWFFNGNYIKDFATRFVRKPLTEEEARDVEWLCVKLAQVICTDHFINTV